MTLTTNSLHRPNPYYPSSIGSQRAMSPHMRNKGTTHPLSASMPSMQNSYTLWTTREHLSTESVTGTLALEVGLDTCQRVNHALWVWAVGFWGLRLKAGGLSVFLSIPDTVLCAIPDTVLCAIL
jgi:hypothetical protein